MTREFNKQFKRLDKKEQRILKKKENKLLKSKIDPIKDKIQDKIPEKLKSTIENAFLKSFQLVFEKGDVYIEKTYKKDRKKLEHDLIDYAIDKDFSNRYIKRLDKQANYSKMRNTSFTVLEGGVLGFLGIGLPDIPLFIAIIMRTIYEVALSYGYDYKSDAEKIYILYIICGAMSQGENQERFNEKIDYLGSRIDQQIDYLGSRIDQQMEIGIDLKIKIAETAEILADTMLIGKFIQGIPLIGIVGGVVNYTIIKKIGKYSGIKYKKRYLHKKAMIGLNL